MRLADDNNATWNDNNCWPMCIVLHIDDYEHDNDNAPAMHDMSLALEHCELFMDFDFE